MKFSGWCNGKVHWTFFGGGGIVIAVYLKRNVSEVCFSGGL